VPSAVCSAVLRSALILLAAFAGIARAADDPAGWTNAYWGMTVDQVRSAVPASEPLAGPAEERTFFCPDRDHPLVSPLGVKHLKLATVDWSVFFLFRDAKLVQVSLRLNDKDMAGIQLYSKLRDLLLDKYGRPFEREDGDKSDPPVTHKSTWTFPLTSIELAHKDFRDLGMKLEFLDLTYAQRTAQEGI